MSYIKSGLFSIADAIEEADKKYPNRHKEIHKVCCKQCPTDYNKRNGFKDLETEDFKQLPKEIIAKEFLFVCAWRNSKLCKGICDEFNVDEDFINSL